MNKLILLSFFIFINSAYANFGGYTRSKIAALGRQYVYNPNNVVELTKERLTLSISDKLNLNGKFWFKNTSDKKVTIHLAFPQKTFWEIPYNEKSKRYVPGKISKIKPKILINGKHKKFSQDVTLTMNSTKKIKFLSFDEIRPTLVEYAGRNEAQSPPQMDVYLWFHKEISMRAKEVVLVDISFSTDWSYKDKEWSDRTEKSDRYFEYITATGGTWKGGVITDFKFIVNLSSEYENKLLFKPTKKWNKISSLKYEFSERNYIPEKHIYIKNIKLD